jgi:hypothetical protein
LVAGYGLTPKRALGFSEVAMSELIRRYFMRSYAWELRRGEKLSRSDLYNRALFQTVLLAAFPVMGAAASLMLFLPREVIGRIPRSASIAGAIMLTALTYLAVSQGMFHHRSRVRT